MTTGAHLVPHRARLGELADALLPGGRGLPSATEAHVLSSGLDRVLAVRPSLAEALNHAATVPGSPPEALARLKQDHPDTYRDVVLVLAGAYFLDPAVRLGLGYPGLAPRKLPAAAGEVEYYLEDNILQAVIDRGPLYRAIPDDPVADVS